MKYSKPHVKFEDQLNLLKDRNLAIHDEEEVLRFLTHTNYYKFSGYLKYFEKHGQVDDYLGHTTSEIMDLYYFDRELRNILNKVLEKIEISIKTRIAYLIGEHYGAFGHLDKSNFSLAFNHSCFIDKLTFAENKSKEVFIKSYKKKYTSERHTPIWMVIEILTLGTLSVMYKNLDKSLKKKIAHTYGASEINFESWFFNIVLLRNFSAHNGRIWNRVYKISSIQNRKWGSLPLKWDRLSGIIYILEYIVHRINPAYQLDDLEELLINHFTKYPMQLKSMGFNKLDDIYILKKARS